MRGDVPPLLPCQVFWLKKGCCTTVWHMLFKHVPYSCTSSLLVGSLDSTRREFDCYPSIWRDARLKGTVRTVVRLQKWHANILMAECERYGWTVFCLSYTNNTPAAKLERRVQVGLPYPNSTRFEGFYDDKWQQQGSCGSWWNESNPYGCLKNEYSVSNGYTKMINEVKLKMYSW